MPDRILHVRLLVRLAGLGLVCAALPRVLLALMTLAALRLPPWAQERSDTFMLFLAGPVRTSNAFAWLLTFGVPIAALTLGAILLGRGSRRLERRLLRVFSAA